MMQEKKQTAIKIEILEYSYWEHFKAMKDISLILPLTHPKRVKIENALEDILCQLKKLKNEN